MYLPTRVKSGSSRFTCVLYAGLAKGGFFNSKSGCVLYADATYTRVYTVPVIYFKMNLLICIINYMPCFYELKLILPFSQLYFFIIGRHNIFIFIYI